MYDSWKQAEEAELGRKMDRIEQEERALYEFFGPFGDLFGTSDETMRR